MIAQSSVIEAYGISIYCCLLYLVLFSWWICEGCPIKLKNEQPTEPIQKRINEAFFSQIQTFFATLFTSFSTRIRFDLSAFKVWIDLPTRANRSINYNYLLGYFCTTNNHICMVDHGANFLVFATTIFSIGESFVISAWYLVIFFGALFVPGR